MIYYLAHSDWILFNSRKEIALELNSSNQKVSAITTQGEYSGLLRDYFSNFFFWNVNKNKLIDIKGIINLRILLKNLQKDDILHVFSLKTGLYLLFASHFLKKEFKTVLSITGLGYLFSKTLKGKILRNFLRFYMRYYFSKNVDTIIFQNNTDKKVFLKYTKYKNTIELVKGSGVNINGLSLRENEFKPSNTTKVIMCCRLLKDKGIEEYFKLSNLISDKKIDFYLSGDIDQGNPASFTKSEIDSLLSSHNIKYLGWLDVRKELKNYDISLCMSYHEGLPRIVLESLYVGLYTISNELPGLKSVFEEKDYGTLISNNDLILFKNSIIRYADIKNHKEKINYSRQKIESQYSTEKILNDFKKIYNSI